MDTRTLSPDLNPIIPGFYPDPSVCRFGEEFFMVHSTFGYFPGIPIFRSRDLQSWTQVGHVLTRPSQLPLKGAAAANGGIYAPTIREHEGRLYVIVTNISHGGNFIVWTDDPEGEWSDPVWLEDGAETGIDPSLFFENGEVWLCGTGTFGRQWIQAARIGLESGKVLSEPIALWHGTGGRYPEGPHLFRRGDWIYLTMAEGGTELGHMQTIARSKSVEGPWEPCPHNPILTHRSMDSVLQAVGHSDLIEDREGKWWVVFHGFRVQGYPEVHLLGRETCVAPVEWSEDGWPVVNRGELIPVRRLDHPEPWWAVEGFAGLGWVTVREPLGARAQVSPDGASIDLEASLEGLDSMGVPSFLAVRQRASSFLMQTELEFEPGEGEEAGLALFMNESHWAFLSVSGESRRVRVVRQVGDMRTTEELGEASKGPLTLRLKGELDHCEASAVDSEGHVFGPFRFSLRLLSTEVAGGFTGLMMGIAAVGVGKTARFGSFRAGSPV